MKRNGAPPLICSAAIAVLVSAGCGPPKRVDLPPRPPEPRLEVVLLPDAEGTAQSAVAVTGKSGNAALTAPYESTTVFADRPPTGPVRRDEAGIRREFGSLLAELPETPRDFNLYFREATSELTEESRAILPDILTAVKARKVPEVAVIGHTDTTGSTASNYQLGLQRAEAVRALLLEAGLDASLVEVESHGEADLLRSTPDNTDEPRNRRVEITDPVRNAVADDTSVAHAESRRFVLLCGLAPALITVALVIFRPDFVADIDRRAYDTLLRSIPTKPPDGRVAIVDIDDLSLRTIGQWPWRRDRIAQLIARLREQGAAVIALDVIFAEADRFATDPKQPSPWDASLARALAEGRVVLGYALTFGTDGGRRDCILHPFPVPMVQPKDERVDVPLFHAEGAICSLPSLAQAAGRSGFLNAAPDSDGILRRVPLVIEYNGTTYPGLPLTAVLAATGAAPVALRSKNENTTSLELTTGAVPLDARSNLLLRYRGAKRSFPYVSAADVLAGRDAGDVFKNAIVFVGTTALGSREVVSTPLDTLFAGVEVQATVADNLLRRDFLSRAEHALTIEVMTVLALGIAITLLVARVGLPLGTIAGAVFLVGVWFTMRWQLSARGQYLSPFFPIVGMMASLGAATLARIAQERRRADRSGREKDLAQRLMVRSLLSLTEVRDADTGSHSRRIQQYSRLLAEELAHHPAFREYLTPERVDLLSSLAPLHDIGKVGVPDHLLNKPGKLTPDEYLEMQKHPAYGLDVINNAQRDVGAAEDEILAMAKVIVYTHHEWWDGKGYPRGIRGKTIPIAGRLVAVVDVYDAMTARRLYRQPVSHEEAVQLIVGGRGTHFDPDVVDAFVRIAPSLVNVGC